MHADEQEPIKNDSADRISLNRSNSSPTTENFCSSLGQIIEVDIKFALMFEQRRGGIVRQRGQTP